MCYWQQYGAQPSQYGLQYNQPQQMPASQPPSMQPDPAMAAYYAQLNAYQGGGGPVPQMSQHAVYGQAGQGPGTFSGGYDSSGWRPSGPGPGAYLHMGALNATCFPSEILQV